MFKLCLLTEGQGPRSGPKVRAPKFGPCGAERCETSDQQPLCVNLTACSVRAKVSLIQGPFQQVIIDVLLDDPV